MCATLRRLALQAVLVLSCWTAVQSMIYPTVRWIPTNPIFSDGNATMYVESWSKVALECPNPAAIMTNQAHSQAEEMLYENMFLVDKHGYDTCTVNRAKPKVNRLLKHCQTPQELAYYTIVFQMFSPIENGLEFETGKEYYIISTAKGTRMSLNDTSGGHCETHNMRLKFYICTGSNDPKCKPPPPPSPSPIVSTVTKTVTVCPTPTSAPLPSSAPSFVLPANQKLQVTPVPFKYATVLSSLASQSQSSTVISPSPSTQVSVTSTKSPVLSFALGAV